jgi:hypothetical protein
METSVAAACDHRIVSWKLTVRAGPKVQRSRYEELEQALEALEQRADEIACSTPRRSVDAKFKSFDPVQQVAARIELSGPQRLLPSVWAGVDVRGDGSTEAYTGRIRRQVVQQRRGESSYRALQRALDQGS